MMRLLLFLVFVLSLANAEMVAPTIYEQKDLGPTAFEHFVYSISVDCTAGTIRVIVMDEDLEPVKGADSYLKYIDFAQPLISSVESDKDGFVLHKLPGDVKLMRGLFILVIQKKDYRSKEIHFDIQRCYANYTAPIPPSQPSEPPEPPPEPEPPPQPVNETPPPNITGPINESIDEINETKAEEEEAPAEICPLSLLLLMLFKFVRG